MRHALRLREWSLTALVLALIAYAWTHSDVTVPNERTRAYLTIALVDHGTLHIDKPIERFGKVYDLASHDGHYFTDKAPGSSLLAVPVYAAFRVLHGEKDASIVEIVALIRTFLMLPLSVLGFVLLRHLLVRHGASHASTDISSLAYALGSGVLHYGGAFYGHVIVSTLALACLACLSRAGCFNEIARALDVRYLVAAGAAAGLLGLTEYQAIAMSGLLASAIVLAPAARKARDLLAYALGALPFALALLAYNTRAFGGPFELSYHHLVGDALRDLHGVGLAGATRPTALALYGLTFSLHRGLFGTAPWTLVAVLALLMRRQRLPRGLLVASSLIALYYYAIVASSSVWFGGWSFGPRLLIPTLPLFALALGLAWDVRDAPLWWNILSRAAVMASITVHALAQITFFELPPSAQAPLADSVRPLLEHGHVAPNLACKVFGLVPFTALPFALLTATALAVVAVSGPGRARAPRIAGSLGLTALVIAGCWWAPMSDAKAREKWLALIERFEARESECAPGGR